MAKTKNESTIYDALSCDVLKLSDRGEWLAARGKLGVGASEVASLFGCGWESQYSLWAKRCEPELMAALADEESEAMDYGNIMEAPILQRYAKQTGELVKAWKQTEICVAKGWPGFCTPDSLIWDDIGEKIGEVKTRNEYDYKNWIEGPPVDIVCQTQFQMGVTGIHRAVIIALFGNRIHRLRIVPVEFDPAFFEEIQSRCERFAAYVRERVEPPVDESEMTYDAIYRLHPDDNGETVELPEESDRWATEWDVLKKIASDTETSIKALKNKIVAAIGDATFGETPMGHRWSWKTIDRAAYTVKAGSYRRLDKKS